MNSEYEESSDEPLSSSGRHRQFHWVLRPAVVYFAARRK